MPDEVTVTLDLTMKPEAAQKFSQAGSGGLSATKAFPGFREVRILNHQDDPCRFLFVQRWESLDAYHAYIAWRTERGEAAALEAMTVRSTTNIWPNVIAAASLVGGAD